MIARYMPQGTMTQTATGQYVTAADYDRLVETLQLVASTATEYFRQIESRELTAVEADAALSVCISLSK